MHINGLITTVKGSWINVRSSALFVKHRMYFCIFNMRLVCNFFSPDTRWCDQRYREAADHPKSGSWSCSHDYCSLPVQPHSMHHAHRDWPAELWLALMTAMSFLTFSLIYLFVVVHRNWWTINTLLPNSSCAFYFQLLPFVLCALFCLLYSVIIVCSKLPSSSSGNSELVAISYWMLL